MNSDDELTQLLIRWGDGDEAAMEQLAPLVYERLHQLAHHAFRREYGSRTLQATAVVNEAWLQLADSKLAVENRNHFYALASRMMRRILVNNAVARRAAKRGGGEAKLTFNEHQVAAEQEDERVIQLNEALQKLAKNDASLEKLLELHYFGGYSAREIAVALAVSESTAKRQLRFARAWVRDYME